MTSRSLSNRYHKLGQCPEHPVSLLGYCRVRRIDFGKSRTRHGDWCRACHRRCPGCVAIQGSEEPPTRNGDRFVFRRVTGSLRALRTLDPTKVKACPHSFGTIRGWCIGCRVLIDPEEA